MVTELLSTILNSEFPKDCKNESPYREGLGTMTGIRKCDNSILTVNAVCYCVMPGGAVGY